MQNNELLNLLGNDVSEKGEVKEELSEVVVEVSPDKFIQLAEILRSDKYKFDLLTNLTAVDYPENFVVVYHLRSLENKNKLTIRVAVDKDNPKLPSAFSVWPAADWQEREVYDLFGIVFSGHPELTRILLPDDFEGYPLRKDYKLQARR